MVGYFRTSGYFKVRAFLEKIPKIRILVGINVDQIIKKYHDKGQLYLANPEETKADFLAEIVKNIQEANYDEVTEKGRLNDAAHPVKINLKKMKEEIKEIRIIEGGSDGK